MLQRNQKPTAERILTLSIVAMSRQLRMEAIIVMVCGLAVGMAADELSGADRSPNTPLQGPALPRGSDHREAVCGIGPRLVLTNRNHVIIADGFALKELEAKIKEAALSLMF